MGRIFKTPVDDSTEATLRAMHTQNTLDTYYEKGLGWVRTLVFSGIAVLMTSLYELRTDRSVWESTVKWFWLKMGDLAAWLTGWVNG